MTLLDEHQGQPPATPAQAAAAAHDFMQRCRRWALEVELPKHRARVAQSTDPADAAALHQWLTWLRFTEHALGELESGTLDRWFLPPETD